MIKIYANAKTRVFGMVVIVVGFSLKNKNHFRLIHEFQVTKILERATCNTCQNSSLIICTISNCRCSSGFYWNGSKCSKQIT